MPVPQLVVTDSRAAMGRPPTRSSGCRRGSSRSGRHGDERARRRRRSSSIRSSRRPGAGPDSWGRSSLASAASGGGRPHDARESIDLQRIFREMLDAGDRSCALEATSHGSELRRLVGVRFAALAFTNLAREHSTSTGHRGLLRRQAAAVRRAGRDGAPPAAVNVGDAWGRRLADELRAHGRTLLTFRHDETPMSARKPVDVGVAVSAAASTFENALRRGRRRAACWGSTRRRSRAGSRYVGGVPGRFEAVDEGQDVRRDRRLRAHAGRRSRTSSRTARELATGRLDLRVRLRRGS